MAAALHPHQGGYGLKINPKIDIRFSLKSFFFLKKGEERKSHEAKTCVMETWYIVHLQRDSHRSIIHGGKKFVPDGWNVKYSCCCYCKTVRTTNTPGAHGTWYIKNLIGVVGNHNLTAASVDWSFWLQYRPLHLIGRFSDDEQGREGTQCAVLLLLLICPGSIGNMERGSWCFLMNYIDQGNIWIQQAIDFKPLFIHDSNLECY